MRSIAVKAYAKINLSLRVAERGSDGFHQLQTIFQSIDLHDSLKCEARRGPFEILCNVPDVPRDRTNLIWRAAQLLWRAGGDGGQVSDTRITLRKRIPPQAGLGGGSSDAAAALLALRTLWKLHVPDEQLVAIAAQIGSDVPFFFVGGTALGLGRGEQVFPLLDLPRWWIVLTFPPFGVSTAEAYAWFDEMRARTPSRAEVRYLSHSWLGRVVPLVNDLEPVVVERHPLIATQVKRLTALGASMAAMSGSGSTVFGVFPTVKSAEIAARKLRQTGASALVTRMRRHNLPATAAIG